MTRLTILENLIKKKDFCPSLQSIWWAQEDLNFRPRPYQGRALTN